MRKLTKILKMRDKLAYGKEIGIILNFVKSFDGDCDVDTSEVRKACNRLQNLLRECLEFVHQTIPPIKTLDKDFVYSVRAAEKPPFIARTNDPIVIEEIYRLFIRLGGWENAKFLFENLRLNTETTTNFTSAEIEKCISQLRELIQDRKSFLIGEAEYDEIFFNDIRCLEMAIKILNNNLKGVIEKC